MFYFHLCLFILSSLCFKQCSSWCWWTKCCPTSESVIAGLEANLTSTLFGQHLVYEPILDALRAHLENTPQKPLSLIFLGPAGVGKTYTAKKIAHHMFDGDQRYVKFYSGRNDFVESKDLAYHKERLASDVISTVSQCGNAVFIFDEAESMADGLFDVLRPFTDFLDNYHGVDYRRAIFIFLSNIGTSEILNIYYNRPKRREDLKLIDFESVLSKWLYNKAGGFKSSSLIVNFLIDYYIPFLPLEDEHIKKCISLALEDYGYSWTDKAISSIYEELPKKKQGDLEYVPSNCKRVTTEVRRYVAGLKRKGRRLIDEM